MQLTTRILNSRVSQRIVLLFISAAILPLLLLAALPLYQVKHQLTEQHSNVITSYSIHYTKLYELSAMSRNC